MKAGWTREGHLARLEGGGTFDVLVIGGGIVGAGVAQDATGRGLTVALAERHDFASGTSSRSTKLLHGGIRYLAQFRFGQVRAGLREQVVLDRTADYLVEPLRFVIPIYRGRRFADAPRWAAHPWVFPIAFRLGLLLYDLMGGRLFGKRRRLRHRRISARQARELVPTLRPEGLKRAITYYDAQTDDARLTLACTATAVATGLAAAANWVEIRSVDQAGDCYVATAHDRLTGREFTIRAHTVVAATGAFAPPAPATARHVLAVRRSKGAHVVTTTERVGLGTEAVVLPETDDRRILYLVPWQRHAVIGTTDTPYDGDPAHPNASAGDVDYIIGHVTRYLDVAPFEPISSWAGLRALVSDGGPTASASREHMVEEIAPGYVQVAGGKLTGYRQIAEGVTNRIAARLRIATESRTEHELLVGTGTNSRWRGTLIGDLADLGIDDGYHEMLYRRYGTRAAAVVTLLRTHPELQHRLGDGSTLAEVVFGARHEAVARISDFTLRRTRLSWFTPDHGRVDAQVIADTLAAELGWDEDRVEEELKAFEEELSAEGL